MFGNFCDVREGPHFFSLSKRMRVADTLILKSAEVQGEDERV